MEALVLFSTSHNLSGVFTEGKNSTRTKTMEACCCQVLKCKKEQQKRNRTCLYTACVVSPKCPKDAAVQFDSEMLTLTPCFYP